MFLNKTLIFAAPDLKHIDVEVPEWPDETGQPGTVRLRQMSADESMKWTKETDVNREDGIYNILVRTAINEDGTPLFTVEDIEELRKKNLHVLNRLQKASLDLQKGSEVALKKDLSGAVVAASPIA